MKKCQENENLKTRNDVKADITKANQDLLTSIKGDLDKVTEEFKAVREEMAEMPAWAKQLMATHEAAVRANPTQSSNSKPEDGKANGGNERDKSPRRKAGRETSKAV